MLPYLCNVAYLITLLVASPWLVWTAVRKGKYREGWAAKFFGFVPRREGDQPCIWLHAVSVGEVNLLATLIHPLRQSYPQHELVITTTTKSGFELAKRKYADYTVSYCPLDFTWAVRRATKRIRPDLLILAELELWPNLIRITKRQGARVAVINGRLSEHSFRGYRRLRLFLRPILRSLDLIAAQNETYADRFRQLGAREESLIITGSLKFDGARTDRENVDTQRLAKLAGIRPSDIVFLAGSTQSPEEAIALAVFQQQQTRHANLRMILVPRHPERFAEVAKLLDDSGVEWQRRTELEPGARLPNARVLLVDTVGELGAWWGTANVAFVGGSMGSRGGQNMIEPAAFGAAVCFGPNTRNFRDIVALMLERDAAVVVQDKNALEEFIENCLTNSAYAERLGNAAQQVVRDQLGATTRTMAGLSALLSVKDRARAA